MYICKINLKTNIMKKLALLFLAALFISCSADEISGNNDEELDCDCDRVVEVFTFNVVGTIENPALTHNSIYTTINDCTQIQRRKTFTTTNPDLSPLLNQCR